MKKVSQKLLADISGVISQLRHEDYGLSLSILNGNSIGKHVRHILDLFECLIDSSESGSLNYDKRKRNPETETKKEYAIAKIQHIIQNLEHLDLRKNLILKQQLQDLHCTINSSTERELLYNIEHCVHHLAIIRIGIENSFEYVEISENFGVAHSTISHREKSSD